MTFVNQIADIVHNQVNKYGGSANKNIGEAFLIVWKFKNKEVGFASGQNQDEIRKIQQENQNIADMAMFSFVKILAKVNKLT